MISNQFQFKNPVPSFNDKYAIFIKIYLQNILTSYQFNFLGSQYDLISLEISSCQYTPCRIPIGEKATVTAEFDTYGKFIPYFHIITHTNHLKIVISCNFCKI